MTITHYINGIEVTPPRNFKSISIELNNESDGLDEVVGLKTFEWIEDAAAILYDWLENGTTGGNGVFEAPTHDIVIQDEDTEKRFELIIDVSEAQYDRDLVIADSMPYANVDWMNKVFEVSFEYLEYKGVIGQSDYVWTPYVISAIPNARDIFIATLTATVVTIELTDVLSEITAATAESASVIDTVGGVITLVSKIIYAVFLLITIIRLILDLFALIIQRVKYVAGMRATDLLSKSVGYFGLQYESGAVEELGNIVIIPPKLSTEAGIEDVRVRGTFDPDTSDQTGYYQDTLAQLIRDLKILVNGRVSIKNKVFKLKTRADIPTGARFQIKDLDQPRFTLNTGDFKTGFNLSFQYDISDTNTIERWKGTNVSVNLEANVADKTKLLIENFSLISIPFAKGVRKKELTGVEKVVDGFLESIGGIINVLVSVSNAAIKVINVYLRAINSLIDALEFFGVNVNIPNLEVRPLENTDLGDLIDNRIGMMLLSSDQTTVHKAVIIDEGASDKLNKVSLANETTLSAKNIYEKYYKVDNRQMKILKFEKVEMSLPDAVNLQEDEAFKLADGTLVELISATWIPDESNGIAELIGKVPFTYNNNLTEVINEPTGR